MEKRRAQQALQQGFPLPEDIQDSPELFPWLAIYLDCYLDCSWERPAAMGVVMPIPNSVFERWGERNGMDQEGIDLLIEYCRIMDNHLREWADSRGNK